jgi:hypothetical protein
VDEASSDRGRKLLPKMFKVFSKDFLLTDLPIQQTSVSNLLVDHLPSRDFGLYGIIFVNMCYYNR